MGTLYWICLLVGGFFVLLSMIGGDADAEADVDFDADADVDADIEGNGLDAADGGPGAGPGLVDLFSLRALFLFVAFFGLTGVLLTWAETGEPWTVTLSALTGLVVALGGNYVIQRVGYESLSSDVSDRDLKGRTGKVLVPFEGLQKGKIVLEAKGKRVQMIARGLGGDEVPERFQPGDQVVIVRIDGTIAEVVKPE